MRILYNNLLSSLSSSAVTVSSELTGFEFSTAIIDSRLSRFGKFSGKTGCWIVFDLGSAQAVTYAALTAHNLSASATIMVEANSSNSWSSPAFSQAMTYADFICEDFASQSYQYWRFTFEDSGNTAANILIGYFYLGSYLQMPGIEPGTVLPMVTTSSYTKSKSGQLYGDAGIRLKTAKVNLPIVEEDQRQDILTWENEVDIIYPFILLLWEDDLDVEPPIYCNLTKPVEYQKLNVNGLLWSISFEFEECK